MTPAGFPHSDIPGSKLVCGSPRLIAAYHVLHRLLVPRHPPCALSSLTGISSKVLHTVFTQRLVFGCQRSIRGARAPRAPARTHRRARVKIYIDAAGGAPDPLSSSGGDSGARTRSLRLAKPALSQLSYIPDSRTLHELVPRAQEMVGLSGLEPPTSRLSGVRSNQLSYRPTTQRRGGVRATVRDAPGLPRPEPQRGPSLAEPGETNRARRRPKQARTKPQAPE